MSIYISYLSRLPTLFKLGSSTGAMTRKLRSFIVRALSNTPPPLGYCNRGYVHRSPSLDLGISRPLPHISTASKLVLVTQRSTSDRLLDNVDLPKEATKRTLVRRQPSLTESRESIGLHREKRDATGSTA